MMLVLALGISAAPGRVQSANTPINGDAYSELLRAEALCSTSLSIECTQLLDRLGDAVAQLTPMQRPRLSYLQAWRAVLKGEYQRSGTLINGILTASQDPNLRFKTMMLSVNSLSEQSRFEEAFSQLGQLVVLLKEGAGIERDVREHGYVVASQLYADAGQFDLATHYAEQIFTLDLASAGYLCVDDHARINALYGAGKWQNIESLIAQGVDVCVKERNSMFANGIRYVAASLDLRQGHTKQAIAVLQQHHAEVQRDGYPLQLAQFESLLAQAYHQSSAPDLARQWALAAVGHGSSTKYAKSVSDAYQVLYLLAKRQGDTAQALAYHEKYMTADKGYLDELSAKALAFQTVEQQVMAKKLQIDTLNKQNEILQLQQSLDRNASETTRLYMVLLLTVIGFIAFWAYRIKRSQLRFMKLARRDGLTGIFNRQHFVTSAEQQLQYCRKSSRQACLVLIDLDHFKVVNDTHGHAVGDRVLKRAVAACQQHLRSTDIFGRLGGEEFGIVLPECTLEQALARAEQIRAAIAEAAVVGDDLAEVPVSASFGVATVERCGYDLRKLLIDADDGLYRAKRSGRNRVMVSDQSQPRERVAGVAVDHG